VSIPKEPQQVKLIASILSSEQALAGQVQEKLVARLGRADFVSPELPFHYTDYYEAEIGKNLFRRLLSFENLISPEALPGIKLYTNGIENELARQDGTRQVNIDPGYISLWHLILATCKAFAHRPYLRDGVYADLTLLYRGKTFTALDWTFPDYRSQEMITLLNGIRERYYRQLKKSET